MTKTFAFAGCLVGALAASARADDNSHDNPVEIAEDDLDLVQKACPNGPDSSAPKRGDEFAAAAVARHDFADHQGDPDGKTLPVRSGLGIDPRDADLAARCDRQDLRSARGHREAVERDDRARERRDRRAVPQGGHRGRQARLRHRSLGRSIHRRRARDRDAGRRREGEHVLHLLQPRGRSAWVLERSVFHGNAFASSSSQSYDRKPGPAAYR